MTTLTLAQLGWIALIVTQTTFAVTMVLAAVLFVVELGGPYLAETRGGGTPWNAEHIAERYGLLVIVALGEEVVGTVATLSALIESQGWSWQVVAVAFAGIALTFGMWWMYFGVPAGEILTKRRGIAFPWGYSHLIMFAAIAAVGAGLHVAALYIEREARVGSVVALLAVVIPVAVFSALIYAYTYLFLGVRDRLHARLALITVAVLVLSLVLAALSLPVVVCLLVAALAPAANVVGFEMVGHGKMSTALERLSPP